MASSHRVYLGGAITGIAWDEAKWWRQEIRANFRNIIDPCDFPHNKVQYEHGEKVADKLVIEYDKNIILTECTIVVVKAFPVSWGSAMEQLYAWEQEKHIIAWIAPDGPTSAWVRYHSHKTETRLLDVIQTLNDLGVE